MIEELKESTVVLTNGNKSNMEMLRRGCICLGFAKYKGKQVHLWLGKIPDLEVLGREPKKTNENNN